MYVSPAVAGDRVFVGSCSGYYYALDKATGAVVWSHYTTPEGATASFHGDPIVTPDVLVTGSDHPGGGNVYALDRESGDVRWMTDVGGVPTNLVLYRDRVIGVTSDGEITALGLADGSPKWFFTADTLVSGTIQSQSPALVDSTVYFADNGRTLYALDAMNGDLIWKRDIGGRASTPVRAVGADLFVGTFSQHIWQLDRTTGAVLGDFATPGVPHHSLTVADSALVVLLGNVTIAAVSMDMKHLRWKRTARETWSTFHPLVVEQIVLAGTSAGDLYALSMSDGSIVWRAHVGGTLRGLSFESPVIYIGTFAGPVIAFEPPFPLGSDAPPQH